MAHGQNTIHISPDLRRKILQAAREFRKNPTPSETILWQALRGKQLNGIKFRRQQPVGPFVVDFYASSLRLVVEVDGPVHEFNQEADRVRSEILEYLGLKVLRFSADQVENDLETVLATITLVAGVINFPNGSG